MWFDHAMFKEKIKFMFANELSIEQVIFEKFVYYDFSRLKINLRSRNIPKVYPEKWNKNKFNTLSFNLTFLYVSSLEVKGGEICCECSPKIISTAALATLLVEKDDFYLRCVARFMSIDEIDPVFDSSCDD